MLLDDLKAYTLILASQSPRRKSLLKEAGFNFKTVLTGQVSEEFPSEMDKYEIPVYLAELKSAGYTASLHDRDILITADTIVWHNQVLNKPQNRDEALVFLRSLSGSEHEVITGLCLRSSAKAMTFYSGSKVFFTELQEEEIVYYTDHFKPYDKAGAYGIQEWIGYIGVERIEGSFYNVMGLPVQQLYHKLGEFIKS